MGEPPPAEIEHRVIAGPDVTPAERDEVLGALRRSFAAWPYRAVGAEPADHLRWKLEGVPGCPNLLTTTEVDGRIACLSIQVRRRVLLEGESRTAKSGVDAVVDPAYQSRGLYRDHRAFLREAVEPQFELTFATTSTTRVSRYAFRAGARPLDDTVEIFVRPLRPREMLRGRRLGPPRALLLAASARLGRLRRGPAPAAVSIVEASDFEERAEAFFAAASLPFTFIVAHDLDYLRWRYVDPGAGRFELLFAEEAGAIVGYAAIKVAGGAGSVADLLTLPGREDVARSLLREALRRFAEAGVAEARAWVARGHPHRRAYAAEGFLRTRRRAGMNYRALAMDPAGLEAMKSPDAAIHLTLGDSDTV